MPRILGEKRAAEVFSGRGVNYPWSEWLDGQAREFIQGEDFQCDCEAFRGAAYVAARRKGFRVRTRIRDKTVFIKAVLNGARR